MPPRIFHQVRPKWFLSLWYVRRKLCTYLASGLALSLNGPNRADGMFGANRARILCVQNKISTISKWNKSCTYLAPTLTLHPNVPKQDSTWPKSPRSYIGCIQNDLWAYGTLDAKHAPILRQYKNYLQTEWNEHPLEPRHIGVPSGACKIISRPMVCSPQTMHLSYVKISTFSKRTESSFHFSRVT
jgi:hypothetical protein